MLENITLSQMMGLVFIFVSFGTFIVTIIYLKTKRFQIGANLYGWERQRKGKDLLIRQEEHPKLFMYGIYQGIIFGVIFLIFGILLTLGVLEI